MIISNKQLDIEILQIQEKFQKKLLKDVNSILINSKFLKEKDLKEINEIQWEIINKYNCYKVKNYKEVKELINSTISYINNDMTSKDYIEFYEVELDVSNDEIIDEFEDLIKFYQKKD